MHHLRFVDRGIELRQHLAAFYARIEVRENILNGAGNVGPDRNGGQRD